MSPISGAARLINIEMSFTLSGNPGLTITLLALVLIVGAPLVVGAVRSDIRSLKRQGAG